MSAPAEDLRLVCTVCGGTHEGKVSESCTGPNQRMVTRAEYFRLHRPAPVRPSKLSAEDFRLQREKARKNADPSEQELL